VLRPDFGLNARSRVTLGLKRTDFIWVPEPQRRPSCSTSDSGILYWNDTLRRHRLGKGQYEVGILLCLTVSYGLLDILTTDKESGSWIEICSCII
jgi:hypothetical protein